MYFTSSTEDGIEISTKDEQPVKTFHPNSTTDCMMSIFDNELHPLKAPSPILEIFEGEIIVTVFKLVHHSKATFSIDSTELGISISKSDLQSPKAFLSTVLTEVGTVILVSDVHLRKSEF